VRQCALTTPTLLFVDLLGLSFWVGIKVGGGLVSLILVSVSGLSLRYLLRSRSIKRGKESFIASCMDYLQLGCDHKSVNDGK
jgi:hypothetical protein